MKTFNLRSAQTIATAEPLWAIPQATQRRQAEGLLPRHRHLAPFATIVLQGRYREAGDSGCIGAGAGDVVLHDRYHAHQDEFGPGRVSLLNLPLPADYVGPAFGRVTDPDLVARLAQRDVGEAVEALLASLTPTLPGQNDWPAGLAADIIRDPALDLGGWALAHGLHPAGLARGFRRVFGVTPVAFRATARARLAARMLQSGDSRLAEIAGVAGFADQAHMTRAVAGLTGLPPGRLRQALAP